MSPAALQSVAHMFIDRVKQTPNAPAFHFPRADESWATLSWSEAAARVRRIALGLRALGVRSEQRCAIQSSTRIEWILADLGILCAGAATTTIYPSNLAEECSYILRDSESQLVFAEDAAQVAKLAERRSELSHLSRVVTFDGSHGYDGWVISLADLEQMGQQAEAAQPDEFARVIDQIRPEHLATLMYTSGTTGRPKGVELTHDCWVFEGRSIDDLGILTPDDHQFLWLPLSHSLGKVLQTAQLAVGFPTSVDGRVTKIVDNLAVVRPTFVASPPRIFEKVYSKVVTGAAEAGGLKLKIFHWAEDVSRKVARARQLKQPIAFGLLLQHRLADKLVYSKLRARFGGRLRFFISGAAPLSLDIAEFFDGAGILILEGYGLTESSAASFVNRPNAYKLGSVGLPIGATEAKLAAEDGEILLRGRGIMRGYHNLAAETADVLTSDGWFHTGDIGEIDAEGFLKITDRKKDLIKTSGGKYIAPQAIEGKLKALCPYLGHVIVHGERRSYCSALVTLEREAIASWAAERGLSASPAELSRAPQVRALVQEAVDKLNATLASYETIKKFVILDKEFSIEDGELTASMKVKRKLVEEKYRAMLDALYV